MRITRFYAESPLPAGGSVTLPPDAAHHAAVVLRLKVGAPVELFDGSGGAHRGRIASVARRSVEVTLDDYLPGDAESPLSITLVQAVSRGQHMDYTLQKAVELGVSRLVPVFSRRSNVRLDEDRAGRRLAHWRRIVIAACEQCGRNRIPDLCPPQPLDTLLGLPGEGARLVLDPEATDTLATLPAPRSLQLLCGPEGGLSGEELRAAREAGWQPVRLGPRVLRTETAAVAVLAACQALWGDLR